MRVRDFLDIIESLAPMGLALDWDNSGLQVGDPMAPVKRLGLALDPTSETILQAANAKLDLLITHHPLIFKPTKRLLSSDPVNRPAFLAAANGLAVISAHTNWDAAEVAKCLAEVLDLTDCRPLSPVGREFLKLVVFVPESHEEAIRRAAFTAGAGRIGKYENCFFKGRGQGGFKVPLDSSPYLGTPGAEETVDEARLEIILPPENRDSVAQAVKAAHPYEEPAFEFYGLTSVGAFGFGAIGRWERPLAGRELAKFLEDRLKTPGLWGGQERFGEVAKVATLPGSGGDFIMEAKRAGADLYVTGEINHHQSLLAREVGLPVFIAGHFETEYPSVWRLAKRVIDAIDNPGEVEVKFLNERTSIRHNL
ncbi:MAG: Nif3-like dinuclear metal center hexameric protein [Deltaproteobacteria bacterium]|jgi:dinuclear metal center YbgI/SA1388 family protein|nr:Nif3-like dinuclear metal center hexameric protein [Deltaproteobacteria bacterium]